MDLKITGIRYENIREFENVELDFANGSNDNPHHISLVQMPNGTGKTTTMNLIRTTLLGKEMDQDEVRSYQPSDFDAIEGAFEIDLVSSGEPFTLRLELDYEVGDHSYRHIKPKEVGGGDMAGHFLPNELNNVITESFVDLFVFNGELTEEFIETGSDEAENALKIVNFLNRLENQKNQIQQTVQNRQEDASVTTQQGYRNIQTRLETTEEKLEELQEKRDELEDAVEDHEETIEELEERRQDILAENEEQLEKDKRLERKIQNLENELETATKDLLSTMRKPSRLDEDLNDDMEKLLENMKIMQLPKSTSQEFFTELAEGKNCICGREIHEEHEQEILDNAEKFLSEQDIGVLNSLKDNLRDTPDYESFDDTFEELQEKRDDLKQAEEERARLDLDDPNLNEKLDKIIEEIEEEEHAKEEKEDKLRRLKTNDKNEQAEFGLDWKNNIPLCKRKREQRKEELRKASGTVNFGKKADILEDIFEEFIEECLKSMKESQIEETNKKLERILGLSKVQVEDIDNSIKIEGRDDISEGQSLSIAYAYLSTLFEDSALDVPFVIDSPAVSIDYEKRAEVAPIISDLFDQLIIFVISPERESFVNELQSNDIQYTTIHKTDTPGKIEKHLDKDFFMDFQSEEERQEAA
ncbi:AAA family ATPase [Halorubrum amylolyticum]|uniref:AAA family ATPase n=1 Tax=Halorubrum amylolyticum TaxID=2508724 RepID=UPI001008C2FD|nr:AAA family ATPase [Halorubrum amylolyticum]